MQDKVVHMEDMNAFGDSLQQSGVNGVPNAKYKDSVFCSCFQEPDALFDLYKSFYSFEIV